MTEYELTSNWCITSNGLLDQVQQNLLIDELMDAVVDVIERHALTIGGGFQIKEWTDEETLQCLQD